MAKVLKKPTQAPRGVLVGPKNVRASSTSTTPIVDKIENIEKLIIDEKLTHVNDEGETLKKVDASSDHDIFQRKSIAWKKICKPKSHGGLDLKDLEGWKNLLEIRDKVIKNVWYKLGNGESTSMWYDNWCELGPLFRFISNRSLYSARFSKDMVVADMVSNGDWKWPS
ncbi:hypothetical protein Tco_1445608, partial [Tanacetum coccineum]